MIAAVIGANGFVGRALCRYCQAQGWEVRGYDSFAGDPTSGLSIRALDIINDPLVLPPETEAVFYLAQAADYRSFPNQAELLFGVNTYGAIRTAQSALAAGVKFLCYASSGSVYSPTFDTLSEESSTRRDDPYALSKLAAEEALRLYEGAIRVLAVRPFGIFGPGQLRMLAANLGRKVQKGEPVILYPTPRQESDPEGLTVSFAFIDDVVYLLERLARLAVSGRDLPPVMNLAGPEAISIRRFAQAIGQVTGRPPIFERGRPARSFDLIADTRLQASLMDRPFTPFGEAMIRSFAPHSQDLYG